MSEGFQHLTVEPVEGRPNFWQVLPHYPDAEGKRVPVAKMGAAFPAWQLACWHRFRVNDTLPKITPGNMFVPHDGKGYTCDPRFAAEVPTESVSDEDRQRIERAIDQFARARAGVMSDLEPLGIEPDDADWSSARLREYVARDREQTKQLLEAAARHVKFHSERLSGDLGGDSPDRASERAGEPQNAFEGTDQDEADYWGFMSRLTSLPERRQHAWQNYAHLAETSTNPKVRAYWQAKADALLRS